MACYQPQPRRQPLNPKLIKTDPPADAVTATTPKELRLSFNEELVPQFSGVELTDKSGKKIEIGTTAPDTADKKQLVCLCRHHWLMEFIRCAGMRSATTHTVCKAATHPPSNIEAAGLAARRHLLP